MMSVLFLLASNALAADAKKPHEHQGKVTPYTSAPPPVSLTADDAAKLTAGQVVLKQVQVGSGGRGVAVMDVRATPERIWSRITSFEMYPQWVDNVQTCEVYRREGNDIYTRFVLDPVGMSVEYFIKHTFRPDQGYMTWALDYSRLSDLDDSVGYWRVTPMSAAPPSSRIEYSVDVRFKGWVPGFVQDMIANKGLTNATAWVKKQSEAG